MDIAMIAQLNGQTYRYPVEPFPADRLATWRGYSLDMHGQPALDPQHPREPAWRIFEDDGTPRHPIELDRIRVRAAGSSLYAELIVLPIEGVRPRPAILGWDSGSPPRIPPLAEIERAVRGLELLGLVRELEASRRRGQPPRYDPTNEIQFFNDLGKAAHEAVRKGRRVNFASLADYGTVSRPTVTKAVESYGYDLDTVWREAIDCTQGANTCTFLWRRRDRFKKKRP